MKQLRKIKFRKGVKCLSFIGLVIVLLSCIGNAQSKATAVATLTVRVVNPSNDMSLNKNLLSHLMQINDPDSDVDAALSPSELLHQRLVNLNNVEDLASTKIDGEPDQESLNIWTDKDRDTQSILDGKGILYLRSTDPLGNPRSKMTEGNTTLTIVSVTD
jgi:hypothetical protein